MDGLYQQHSKYMLTYHNDIKIKEKYIARVDAHAKADAIVQGTYWQNGKGCAVGCTIEGSDHGKYETELGIPRAIARLEDRIFEGLSNEEAKEFPLKFLKAVNVGADLSMVMPRFFVWLLADPKDGVINFVGKYKKCAKAIKQVAKLYGQVVGGKEVKREKWIDARHAADAAYAAADAADAADADADAADTAAAAAAAAAAYAAAADAAAAAADAADAADADADAADAAAYAAADAAAAAAAYAAAADAYAYAAAYARRTARQVHYSKMANKLLELLAEAK